MEHIYDHLKKAVEDYEKRKAVEAAARASVAPLKQAKTAGEIDNASDSSLGGV